MNKHIIHLASAFLALTIMCISSQFGQAADLMIHYHERPPYYVTCEQGFGGIIGERVRAVFAEAGVSYDIKLTPAKRQLKILQQNTDSDCMVGWFLIPRRKTFALYSKPIYQDQPMVVLTRKDNNKFDEPFTLSGLLSNQTLQLLIKDSYSYGMIIDSMMLAHPPNSQLTTTENDNMIRMIHAGRADYMFIGSEEAEIMIARSNLPRNDFRVIYPSGMPPFNKRYLLFSKNVSPALIKRIDQAIEKLYPIAE